MSHHLFVGPQETDDRPQGRRAQGNSGSQPVPPLDQTFRCRTARSLQCRRCAGLHLNSLCDHIANGSSRTTLRTVNASSPQQQAPRHPMSSNFHVHKRRWSHARTSPDCQGMGYHARYDNYGRSTSSLRDQHCASSPADGAVVYIMRHRGMLPAEACPDATTFQEAEISALIGSDIYRDVATGQLKRRLLMQLRRFRDPLDILARYHDTVKAYFNESHAERVPNLDSLPKTNTCSMPHHEVIRRDAFTMSDASSHAACQPTLKKQEPSPPIVPWRMTRMLFGATSTPFLLAATLHHHLRVSEKRFPETAECLRQSFYVDDLVVGADNV
ncbi:hypothetical protein HPB50_000810 [Hyalomma asiaticum]|uniref:Uncharacterized protein n=1 Tax=Hyalomma asiaticum TaxID=266040 RepID=A0ACB7SHY6_HYAAI|nr:hypothetical protein HPB50_000810 [Hyalomma asiaticum]